MKWLSPTTLEQLRHATRPVRFATDLEEFPTATYGGTLTLIEMDGRILAVTCGHVAGDFPWNRLLVSTSRAGGLCARLSSILRTSKPIDHAIDSDIMDIVVIELSSEHDRCWFEEPPLRVDEKAFADCAPGDTLIVSGFPTRLSDWSVVPASVESIDFRVRAHRRELRDVVLRTASGNIGLHLDTLSGMSGSPVIRESDGKLCGIVVRGGISANADVQLTFVEASDILQILYGANRSSGQHRYDKQVHIVEVDFPLPESE
jgi:hypothetical protein